MPVIKFTQTNIERKTPPADSPVMYWDEDNNFPGLGILVSPKGTKTWIAQRKIDATGKSVRVTLDRVKRTPLLKDAWALATPKLAEIYNGVNPKEKRRQERAEAAKAITVEQAIEKYLAAAGLKPTSVDQYRSYLTEGKGLYPWAKRQLRSITPEEVELRYNGIIAEIKARPQKGGLSVTGKTSAGLAMTVFSAAWRWARNSDTSLPPSPTWILSKRMSKPEPRQRIINEDQMAAWYAAALKLQPLLRDAVIYALYTGARLNEAVGLLWSEVDTDKRIITIDADRMKGGKAHSFPMNDTVHTILVSRKNLGGKWVFPGREGPTTQFPKALRDIAKECGIYVSPHDLRRTYITVAESCEGLSVYQLKRLVAHSGKGGGDVTANYIRMQEARLAAGAKLVCDRLKELCQPPQLSGNVTNLRA